jgi:hypothetical protein
MGELSEYLNDRKTRLLQLKQQHDTYDETAINQKLARINAMLTKLENNPGWDV